MRLFCLVFHAARNANSMAASRPIVALSPHHFERVAATKFQTTHDHLSSSINLKLEDWLLFWLLLFHFFIETSPNRVSGDKAAWTYKAARHDRVPESLCLASKISTILFYHVRSSFWSSFLHSLSFCYLLLHFQSFPSANAFLNI